MKATLRITNATRFRSDHLRAFAVAARFQVFGEERAPLHVHFKPSRSRIHGRATVSGSWSCIWLPPDAASRREELAQILVHEFAHNAGAKGERWMRRGTKFGWGPGWRENVAWALTLPLEVEAQKLRAPTGTVLAGKIAALEKRQARWTAKAKRAATALRKIARSHAYYQRRLAAISAGGKDGGK